MTPSWTGTSIVATTVTSSTVSPRKRSFAKAKPARVQKNTTERATTPATIAELARAVQNAMLTSPELKTRLMFSTRWWPGVRTGGYSAIAELSREATTNDQ